MTGFRDPQNTGFCRYIRLDSTIPGGVCEADSQFSKLLLDYSLTCASSEPTGSINFPIDWTRYGFGGSLELSGGKDYNVKFDASKVVDKSNLVIIFWVMNNSKYGKLREIEGCEKLEDLKATTSDIVYI